MKYIYLVICSLFFINIHSSERETLIRKNSLEKDAVVKNEKNIKLENSSLMKSHKEPEAEAATAKYIDPSLGCNLNHKETASNNHNKRSRKIIVSKKPINDKLIEVTYSDGTKDFIG